MSLGSSSRTLEEHSAVKYVTLRSQHPGGQRAGKERGPNGERSKERQKERERIQALSHFMLSSFAFLPLFK